MTDDDLFYFGWQPIATAPRDRLIWLYAPRVGNLQAMECVCRHSNVTGWWLDEYREATMWRSFEFNTGRWISDLLRRIEQDKLKGRIV